MEPRKAAPVGFVLAIVFAIVGFNTDNSAMFILAGAMIALGAYLWLKKTSPTDKDRD